jgi:hypothetical protein
VNETLIKRAMSEDAVPIFAVPMLTLLLIELGCIEKPNLNICGDNFYCKYFHFKFLHLKFKFGILNFILNIFLQLLMFLCCLDITIRYNKYTITNKLCYLYILL